MDCKLHHADVVGLAVKHHAEDGAAVGVSPVHERRLRFQGEDASVRRDDNHFDGLVVVTEGDLSANRVNVGATAMGTAKKRQPVCLRADCIRVEERGKQPVLEKQSRTLAPRAHRSQRDGSTSLGSFHEAISTLVRGNSEIEWRVHVGRTWRLAP